MMAAVERFLDLWVSDDTGGNGREESVGEEPVGEESVGEESVGVEWPSSVGFSF